LEAKYGALGDPVLGIGVRSKTSLWWRDLVGSVVVRGVAGDCLQDAFVKRIGNGADTEF
jgi:hypothetical protein